MLLIRDHIHITCLRKIGLQTILLIYQSVLIISFQIMNNTFVKVFSKFLIYFALEMTIKYSEIELNIYNINPFYHCTTIAQFHETFTARMIVPTYTNFNMYVGHFCFYFRRHSGRRLKHETFALLDMCCCKASRLKKKTAFYSAKILVRASKASLKVSFLKKR